jgi:septal ring factor EnvC (AmiA/AmiB activator)
MLASVLVSGIIPLTKKLAKIYLEHSKNNGSYGKFQQWLAQFYDIGISETKTYKQRLDETLKILKNAFNEVDKATVEFTELMKEKEKNMDILEKRLTELSSEEHNLKSKVATLQQVPLEAIKHFEEILNKGDKRSASRDYILFISGIVVSVIITIILKLYFGL